MSTSLASRIAVFAALALLLAGWRPTAEAHTCGSPPSCIPAGGTCHVFCDGSVDAEADLRAAISAVESCGGSRTIKFVTGSCPVCSIPVQLGGLSPSPITIDGSSITIDGENKVTFVYSGPFSCARCTAKSGILDIAYECNEQNPFLFHVFGSSNVLKNFSLRFIPGGIELFGSNNTVNNLDFSYFCQRAVTAIGSGTAVINSRITGHIDPADPSTGRLCWQGVSKENCTLSSTCPSPLTCALSSDNRCACNLDSDCESTGLPGDRCYCLSNGSFGVCGAGGGRCYRPSKCGVGTAIEAHHPFISPHDTQLVIGNTFENVDVGVFAVETLSFTNNRVCGSPSEATCGAAAIFGDASGANPMTFNDNQVTNCSVGLTTAFMGGSAGTTIEADNNIITNSGTAAFSLSANITPVLIKGSGNRLKNNGGNPPPFSDAGSIGSSSNVFADFGGGDFSGNPVFGGSTSAGLNLFCSNPTADIAVFPTATNVSIGARNSCYDGAALETSGPNIAINGSAQVGTGICGGLTCNFAEPTCD